MIEGFSKEIFCNVHPSGDKQGGVCIYFKENLPIKPNDEFEVLFNKLQDTLDQIRDTKLQCTILTGNFNCRSTQFWPGDIDSLKGIALHELVESKNMTQLIDQPTNLEPRGISSVDLIITDQPNLFVDHRIHSSLDNCCHRQIIYGKVNISIPSPPSYKRRMWDYAKANKDEIRKCLSNIDWDSKFENLSVNDMVSEFTTTVLDILSRFIPNKIAICNDKDPLWITPEIKTAIKCKH